jgi:hypothetical protein
MVIGRQELRARVPLFTTALGLYGGMLWAPVPIGGPKGRGFWIWEQGAGRPHAACRPAVAALAHEPPVTHRGVGDGMNMAK